MSGRVGECRLPRWLWLAWSPAAAVSALGAAKTLSLWSIETGVRPGFRVLRCAANSLPADGSFNSRRGGRAGSRSRCHTGPSQATRRPPTQPAGFRLARTTVVSLGSSWLWELGAARFVRRDWLGVRRFLQGLGRLDAARFVKRQRLSGSYWTADLLRMGRVLGTEDLVAPHNSIVEMLAILRGRVDATHCERPFVQVFDRSTQRE